MVLAKLPGKARVEVNNEGKTELTIQIILLLQQERVHVNCRILKLMEKKSLVIVRQCI